MERKIQNKHRNGPFPASPTNQIALFSLLSLITGSLVWVGQVAGSPPIDYFIYTSPSSQRLANNGPARLSSLESIYELQNQASTASSQDKLRALAERTLRLVRNSSHTHDNDLVDIEATRYAWQLMELQGFNYMQNKVNLMKPFLDELLREAQVSPSCTQSIDHWLEKLKRLDHWATLMWNSWGNFPPSGIFEGSFTDLGSYKGCMSIRDNPMIGQAQYCTFDYQPLIPTRPRFHSIYKKILDSNPSSELINGDFVARQPINSQVSAHQFSSERFKMNSDSLSRNIDLDNPNNNGKYNKRTIEHNITGAEESLQQEGAKLNLTLKAEVSSIPWLPKLFSSFL